MAFARQHSCPFFSQVALAQGPKKKLRLHDPVQSFVAEQTGFVTQQSGIVQVALEQGVVDVYFVCVEEHSATGAPLHDSFKSQHSAS
jgi:hypothetical protein